MGTADLTKVLLPGVPLDRITSAYGSGKGAEIASGKFFSPESSACLAANTFGWFTQRPKDLPRFPGTAWSWPPGSVELEAVVRFPWRGGRHPVLDALIETQTHVIGVESKRYEPFRPKESPSLSKAYWRQVWGNSMARYEQMRDDLRDGTKPLKHLDATQLVKHAFGLRTLTSPAGRAKGKKPILIYLYAEPQRWLTKVLPESAKTLHRSEAQSFATHVAGDEVEFVHLTYRELLSSWKTSGNREIQDHADNIMKAFDLC